MNKVIDNQFICYECERSFKTKSGLGVHKWRKHTDDGLKHKSPFSYLPPWNKGLTNETDDRIKKSRLVFSENLKSGKIIHPFKDKHHSKKSRDKISNGMKIAHAEGRACKWKTEESFAEKLFNKFLQNNGYILNDDYLREHRVGLFRIDFYFRKLNLAIEIDGQQHYRYEEMKKRDKIKNKLLKNKGMVVLRIAWIVLFHNSKIAFKKIEDILNTNSEKLVNNYNKWQNGQIAKW